MILPNVCIACALESVNQNSCRPLAERSRPELCSGTQFSLSPSPAIHPQYGPLRKLQEHHHFLIHAWLRSQPRIPAEQKHMRKTSLTEVLKRYPQMSGFLPRAYPKYIVLRGSDLSSYHAETPSDFPMKFAVNPITALEFVEVAFDLPSPSALSLGASMALSWAQRRFFLTWASDSSC